MDITKLSVKNMNLKINSKWKETMQTMQTDWGCGVLIFVGLRLLTPEFKNLELRNPTLTSALKWTSTPGQKSDSDSGT